MKPLVFAIAQYLNSAPLTEGLYSRADVEVLYGVPAAHAAAVRSGRADVGMMPVVDALFDPDLSVIDGMGVCADGKVRSVLLRCRRPLDQVRTVAADPASRTSNLLVRLLLRVRLGTAVTVTAAADADASVMIGDRALAVAPGPYLDYDLAEEWKRMTGLPFVFAVWTHRRGDPRADAMAQIAAESLAAGMAVRDEIALRYAERLSLPVSVCRNYLSTCVYHTVGAREKHAMAEFTRLLEAYALTPPGEGASAHAT